MSVPDWADEGWSSELPVLRAKGENQDLEYMESFPQQARDLAKEIAAFATSNQGTILIGVSNAGDLVGLDDASTFEGRDKLLRRIEGICRGTIKPAITPVARFAVESDHPVLVLLVPKGSQPVYYSGNVPYVRHITESRPAEPHEVIELVRAYLPAKEPDDGKPDPFDEIISRLALILRDVIIYCEESDERMLNPWLDLFRAQFEQAASELRELAIDDVAIEHDLADDLNHLITALDEVVQHRLHLGSEPELESLVANVFVQARATWSKWIEPTPLSDDSLHNIRAEIIRAARKLRDLCDRMQTMLDQGRTEEIQSEASRLGFSLLRAAQFNLDALQPGLANRLRDVGRPLHLVETRRLYMDGGQSDQAVADTVAACFAVLEEIVASLTS